MPKYETWTTRTQRVAASAAVRVRRRDAGRASSVNIGTDVYALRTLNIRRSRANDVRLSYVLGFAQQEVALPLDPTGAISAATEEIIAQQEAMADAFPNLADLTASLILQPGYAYGNEFEYGLKLILDGIAAVLGAETAT